MLERQTVLGGNATATTYKYFWFTLSLSSSARLAKQQAFFVIERHYRTGLLSPEMVVAALMRLDGVIARSFGKTIAEMDNRAIGRKIRPV